MGTLVRGLLIWLATFSPLKAHGEVNPQDGSYERTDLDSISPNFVISRTYSSRSLHMGLFGLGWCSELDQKLIQRNGAFEVHYCDLPPAKIARPTKPGHEISYQLGNRQYTFSYDGRLLEIRFPSRKKLDLLYDRGGRILELHTNSPREIIRVGFDSRMGRVTSLQRKKVGGGDSTLHRAVNYRYEGNHLMSVKKGSNSIWSYRYDEASNLISVIQSEGQKEEMKYDLHQDWIRWIKDFKGCEHFIRYEQIQKTPGHRTYNEVRCGGRWVKREQNTFYFKDTGSRSTYITNVLIEEVNDGQE